MQEYGDYLIEKAAYEVDQEKRKIQKKMGYFGKAIGFATSFAIGELTRLIKEPLSRLWGSPFVSKNILAIKLTMWLKVILGFGDKSDAYQKRQKTGYNLLIIKMLKNLFRLENRYIFYG